MNAQTNGPARADIRVMAHLVAGYTTDDVAFAAAEGLAAGGVSYFEIQLPFSDPSADGPAIQTACARSLERGFRVSGGFAFASRLRAAFPEIPVFLMSYANLLWKPGIRDFVARAADAGVAGLIVPDLPFDSDEGLRAECEARSLVSVPVAAPSMSPGRIALLSGRGFPYVYAALRAGITGKATVIDDDTLAFLRSLGAPETPVLGGFGIRTGEQSGALAPHVHAVVAGSVFVTLIAESAADGPDAVRLAVEKKARELAGSGTGGRSQGPERRV